MGYRVTKGGRKVYRKTSSYMKGGKGYGKHRAAANRMSYWGRMPKGSKARNERAKQLRAARRRLRN
jgi:hypothetical protein